MVEAWVLPEDLRAAGAARDLVAADLTAHGVTGAVVDDAVIIASELAANAVRHGTPPALLELDYDDRRVRIRVSNHGNAPDPRVLTADPDAEHGRGLAMVERIADEVGWERDGDRLDVWADLRLTR